MRTHRERSMASLLTAPRRAWTLGLASLIPLLVVSTLLGWGGTRPRATDALSASPVKNTGLVARLPVVPVAPAKPELRLAVAGNLVAALPALRPLTTAPEAPVRLTLETLPPGRLAGPGEAALVEAPSNQPPLAAEQVAERYLAVVSSVTSRWEAMSLEELRALLDPAARRPGSPTVLVCCGAEDAVRAILGLPGGRAVGEGHLAPESVLQGVRGAPNTLGLVPWEAVTGGVKALRVEGARPIDARPARGAPAKPYPLTLGTYLAWGAGAPTGLARDWLVGGLRAALALPEEIELVAGGDVMLARKIGQAIAAYGAAFPFAEVAPVLRRADIAFVNLECTVSERGEPVPKSFNFRATPESLEALTLGGVNVVSLANNHGMDYGPPALLDTLDLLAARNIAQAGGGANAAAAHTPAVLTVQGLRLAFLAYAAVDDEAGWSQRQWTPGRDSPGLAYGEEGAIREDVARAREQADLVVVSLHAGTENSSQVNDLQRQLAHAAIEAGATLVLGAHPHVLQGLERYGDGLIAYSLGDFVFDITDPPDAANTLLLRVVLTRQGIKTVDILPVYIVDYLRPVVLEDARGDGLLQRIYGLSKLE